MLAIKFSRTGKKGQPTFRLVVLEKSQDPWGKYLELLGTYNPRSKDKQPTLRTDRILHWIKQGAQPTPSVHNLLLRTGVIKGEKQKAVRVSNKRRAKLQEKKTAETAKVAASAVKTEEVKAEPAVETPTAETPTEVQS